jgi:mono/diheme cytochrome c family protein
VLPVLGDRCMGCHRAGRAEGGLVLTDAAGLLRGGDHGAAVVPGRPEEGTMPAVLRAEHPDISPMPRGKRGPLPEDQIEAIRLWIEQGAVWPE